MIPHSWLSDITIRVDLEVTSPPVEYSHATRGLADPVEGSLYVDLYREGETVPGFDEIVARKPAAIVTARAAPDGAFRNVPTYFATDMLAALREIAGKQRGRRDVRTVCVTGSVGKSTTTSLISHMLEGQTHQTVDNRNDDVDTPVTVLNLPPHSDNLVLEIGTWRPGEIAYCASIAKPDCGVITNVGLSHLERFGTQENIAKAKSELLQSLPEDGVGCVPAETPFDDILRLACRSRRVWTFSTATVMGANAVVLGVEQLSNGAADCRLSVHGQRVRALLPESLVPTMSNVLAACLASVALGHRLQPTIDLSDFSPPSGRLQISQHPSGGRIIDDSFNASPDSTRALAEFISRSGRRTLAIFGGMAELGHDAVKLNESAIYELQHCCDGVSLTGPLMEQMMPACAVTSREATLILARDWLLRGDQVAVKGSNAAGLTGFAAELQLAAI